MSRRKLNLQQKKRIEKNQAEWRDEFISENTQTGLVLCSYGKRAEIQTQTNTLIECKIRPNLPLVVAGDRVIWQTADNQSGVILSVCPRNTLLDRKDKYGKIKPLAANVSQLMIVIAPVPITTWSLLDTYLITAEMLKLKVVLILNKMDLPEAQNTAQILQTHYQGLGYDILPLCKDDPKSVTLLTSRLQNEASIFVGQSGVGKSSLIKSQLPHIDSILTGELSSLHQLGKHTTSHTRYYPLPQGGGLIDSPGVRAFLPPFLDAAHITLGYREFQPYLGRCQFRNCPHINTPGCAITQALLENHISDFRYQQFVKLIHEHSA